VVETRLRRFYRLTPQGTARLAAELDRLRRHAAVAARRLALLGGTA
jgi:PadR family transcriptional regulator, regulatory protein PadR